ncbi:Na+/H+ antiporter [Saccharothrix sp. ST-888]|uniref:Na+/H+ antiporter n=1 Tax=Saccharothrix sp. ST-888 TaxID=1427391 RepID=UPI0005EBFBBF|nr:Na+/H+ antiporter [Saccharothrix sp. ST-888]KJK55570.1 sodium:proton antiporter [Saccharothrix sp. ST-888]
MLGLELVVLLCIAVLLSTTGAEHARIAPPVLLLVAGVLLGFIPALREVQLPPEVVLLLFLPVLLYWESLTTSLREIRFNLRGIVLLSTVLVITTAAAAAATAHALGLPNGPAWVLGATVAPTDVTAVGVVARLLPRRNLTVLRAESLINDGTALVIYGLAVGITVGQQHLGTLHVSRLFVVAYAGGALIGTVTAYGALWVRRRQADPLQGQVTMLLTPFTAFLTAATIGASGVVAVVVCGLIVSQASPRMVRADMRLQAQAFWTVATFLLNGALFVLVGLELQSAVRGLTSTALPRALTTVVVVTAVLVGVRFAFLFASAYLIRALDRRPQQRLRRYSNRARVVSGLCGFRGVVSLAAALAVPRRLHSGAPFPDRDMIVFVTGGVIALTLLQGLVLPAVVRWARLPHDTALRDERRLADTLATEEALRALPQVAADLGTSPEVVDDLRLEYEKHLMTVRARGTDDHPAVRYEQDYTTLRLALIAHKRAAVVRLRDEHRIDDTVLRQVQERLDIEEVRLTQRGAVD